MSCKIREGGGVNLPKRQILDCSKFKEFADDYFKFDEKSVKNAEGKGEMARYKQFLLFPQFSKDFFNRHIQTLACLEKG